MGQDKTLPRDRWKLARLSPDGLWSVALVAGLFLALRAVPIHPQDFWWHIAVGREIVTTGHIPAIDAFSTTQAGAPYNYAAYWLMESLLYLLYHWGGPALVLFCYRLAIAASFWLVFHICRQISQSTVVAGLCWFFAALLTASSWNLRPQVIAFPLTALFLWAIYRYRRQRRAYLLAVFPACMALWVNGHGSFIMGFVLLGTWFGDEAWRWVKSLRRGPRETGRLWPPVVALGASALALLLNPQGFGILRYVASLSGNPMIQQNVTEWAPPSFGTTQGALFLAGLMLTAAILAVSPARPTALQMLTFLGLGLASLKTSRSIIWFGMAVAPVLAGHLPLILATARQERTGLAPRVAAASAVAAGKQAGRERAVINYGLAAILLAAAALSLPWFNDDLPAGQAARLISEETPVRATAFLLQARPPGNLYNEQAFGSYLIWAAQPAYPVFVDPRLDLYPASLWDDYGAIASARADWEQLLARYKVNTLMLDRLIQPAILAAVRQSPAWQLLYEDERDVIFTRTSGRAS